jgi:hypothetical protein
MPERQSVEFERVVFNVISDEERGTITLQFSGAGGRSRESREIEAILNAIEGRYAKGIRSRPSPEGLGSASPLVLPLRSKPHPEAPDVLCFEMRVKPGERMGSVLADFMDFLSQQPGYRRTFGNPLDRDQIPLGSKHVPPAELSNEAGKMLTEMFRRRTKDSPKDRP